MRIGRIVLASALGAAVASPAFAAEPYLGRWAKAPEACHGFGNTALVATMTSVSWVDGYCRIGKMYKIGHAVYLQLHCSGKGDVPATLNAYGDRMRVTWGGAKIEELRRCK
ncbi:MAG: hypothetical protein FJX62_12535 [Alphaproteobacteria bacterium]|nr:hypothetical protein [Alphaproteobacteria bacterium]